LSPWAPFLPSQRSVWVEARGTNDETNGAVHGLARHRQLTCWTYKPNADLTRARPDTLVTARKKVLRRETSLADALRLRLAAVEAHVASLQRIGAALPAALRSEPNEDDVRRWITTAVLHHFV
jgi:hypothetical protein